jgi:hypothetical protein
MVPNGHGFRQATRVTVATGATAVFLGIVSLALPSSWRMPIAYASATVALYLTARVLTLTAFEQRQREFQTEWLAGQTTALRGHAFELLWLTVGEHRYDPTRATDMRDLPDLRVTLTFTYLAANGSLIVTQAHRERGEIAIQPGWAAPGRASVRFPNAHYLPQPEPGHHPARRARWSLDGPVVVAISASDTATASGAGTRNSR